MWGQAFVIAGPLPFIPAHSASIRAFTPVFDRLWTRVNALMLGIQSQAFELLGPRFRGDERMLHEGGAYFAGLGFELRSGAPPGLNPKLPSSSSAA
jgi:hypothetical protein